jgi:O-methyltransferase
VWHLARRGELFREVKYEVVRGPLTYNSDGLATRHSADFMAEPKFAAAYELGKNSGHMYGPNLQIQWRAFVNCWAAEYASKLTGDFVECGTNTGIYARAIASFVDLGNLSKRFFLFDTFTGIPPEQFTDRERAGLAMIFADKYAPTDDTYQNVVSYFSKYPNVFVIRGRVPETLPQCDATSVSYLSIDMNSAAPEVAAIEYFWPKLVPGAIVVLDDYGFRFHEDQKEAMDRFAAQHGTRVLAMPTGQGLLIKQ